MDGLKYSRKGGNNHVRLTYTRLSGVRQRVKVLNVWERR